MHHSGPIFGSDLHQFAPKNLYRKIRGEKFYRLAATTLGARVKKKLIEKTTWYKSKRKEKVEMLEKDMIGENGAKLKKVHNRKLGVQKSNVEKTSESNNNKNKTPKTVIFIPYTKNSQLAKLLRDNERKMTEITGMSVKFVERSGIKLCRTLCQTNPWSGQDCLRPDCLMCESKADTGLITGQDCTQRSLVYETWCESCRKEDECKLLENGEIQPQEIKLYKYIGETSKIGYERGKNHIDDKRLVHPGSHMLKHCVKKHHDQDWNEVIFRMKAIKFHRSAFERQLHEATLLQQARKVHIILNSKSEYSRCTIPRLSISMGDKVFRDKIEDEEKKKEEMTERRILEVRKSRMLKGPEKKRKIQSSRLEIAKLEDNTIKKARIGDKVDDKNKKMEQKERSEVNEGKKLRDVQQERKETSFYK